MSFIRNAMIGCALLALTLVLGLAVPASAERDLPPEAPRGIFEAQGR